LAWLGEHAPGSFTLDDLVLLQDPDLTVRVAAVVALRAASDAVLVNGARIGLRRLVEGDAAERHAGLRAAAAIGNPTLAPRLLPFLKHDEPETRRLTLLALAAVPPGLLPPTFLPDLLTPLLADPDPGVRATAEAILHSGGQAAG
jgi:HEAT repeat protein